MKTNVAARLLITLAAARLFAAPARAHDPYECWTAATLRADELTLVITMAQSTALRLIDPQVRVPALTPENFATHRPRLEQEARTLYVLTSGRQPLATPKVEVELTGENDVVFKAAYPRPAPGRLHFHAAFLKKLGDGYGGMLEVSDIGNRHLGWDQLWSESPNFEVTVPAPEQAKKTDTRRR